MSSPSCWIYEKSGKDQMLAISISQDGMVKVRKGKYRFRLWNSEKIENKLAKINVLKLKILIIRFSTINQLRQGLKS